MSLQKFRSSQTDTFKWPNGAVGHRGSMPPDCAGPFAKVRNCPIQGTEVRLTCYATAGADTFYSVPACTRYKGRYIAGYLTSTDYGIEFVPIQKHAQRIFEGHPLH